MFDNIGSKIKSLATIVCIVGIVASCLTGLVMMFMSGELGFGIFIVGLLIAAIGSLASWVGSFAVYGFGELIDNTTEIRKVLKGENNTNKSYYDLMMKSEPEKGIPVQHVPGSAGARPVVSQRNPGSDEWKCPKCQRIHKNYETSCICGYNKNRPQG